LVILTNFHVISYAMLIMTDYSPIPYAAIQATAE